MAKVGDSGSKISTLGIVSLFSWLWSGQFLLQPEHSLVTSGFPEEIGQVTGQPK